VTARNPNKLPVSEQNRRNSQSSPWRRRAACQTHKAREQRRAFDHIDREKRES